MYISLLPDTATVARRKETAMKKMLFSLDEDEMVWLKRVILDRDKEEALDFVIGVLGPRLKEAERPTGLQRTFDAGGPPGQIGGPR